MSEDIITRTKYKKEQIKKRKFYKKKRYLFKKGLDFSKEYKVRVFIAIINEKDKLSVLSTCDDPDSFIATYLQLPLQANEILTNKDFRNGLLIDEKEEPHKYLFTVPFKKARPIRNRSNSNEHGNSCIPGPTQSNSECITIKNSNDEVKSHLIQKIRIPTNLEEKYKKKFNCSPQKMLITKRERVKDNFNSEEGNIIEKEIQFVNFNKKNNSNSDNQAFKDKKKFIDSTKNYTNMIIFNKLLLPSEELNDNERGLNKNFIIKIPKQTNKDNGQNQSSNLIGFKYPYAANSYNDTFKNLNSSNQTNELNELEKKNQKKEEKINDFINVPDENIGDSLIISKCIEQNQIKDSPTNISQILFFDTKSNNFLTENEFENWFNNPNNDNF